LSIALKKLDNSPPSAIVGVGSAVPVQAPGLLSDIIGAGDSLAIKALSSATSASDIGVLQTSVPTTGRFTFPMSEGMCNSVPISNAKFDNSHRWTGDDLDTELCSCVSFLHN
jgi:hypothetical protein